MRIRIFIADTIFVEGIDYIVDDTNAMLWVMPGERLTNKSNNNVEDIIFACD